MVENCNFVAQKCSSNCVTFGEFDKPDSLPDLASVITPHNSEIEKVTALIAQTFFQGAVSFLSGLFCALRGALDSPRALLLELQRYKDTVRCAVLGAEFPGHRQQQITQTLIVGISKTHKLTPILACEKSTEKI